MVNNLKNLRIFYVIHSLVFLIMVHQNNLLFAHSHKIPPGNRSDTFSLFADYRKRPVAVFHHLIFNIIGIIFCTECNQIVFSHNIAYRNALIDHSGRSIGIQRTGDEHASVLGCQTFHFITYAGPQTNDHTADAPLDHKLLVFLSVCHNNQVMVLDMFLHKLRMSRPDNHFTFCKIGLLISHHNLPVYSLGNTLILCLGFGKNPVIRHLHVNSGNISDCDKPLQMSFLVFHKKGNCAAFPHHIPCGFHRIIPISVRTLSDIHILYLSSHIADISRRVHAKPVQHICSLLIELSRPFCRITLICSPVLNICIGNCRADRICIRIFMANDNNFPTRHI